MALTIGKANPKVRLLIYGSPGTRKTSFAGDFPNPIWFDWENSTSTFVGTKYADIPVFSDIREIENPQNILNFIRTKNDYETYVLDSVSSMYEAALMAHMRTKGKTGDSKYLALFQDFRILTNVMKEVFHTLIHCDKHVVVIAHEKELREQETNKLLQIRPFVPPEIEKSIERLVNEVFYFELKKGLTGNKTEHIIHVESQGKILAKNRQAHLTENKYTDITLKDIYKTW